MESEMNIQKEREAFEAVTNTYHCIYNADLNYYFSGSKFVGDKAEIEVNAGWKSWQAVKAQVVPEGFVVLKICDVREIISNASDAMDGESPSTVLIQTGNPSTWYDYHLVAERNILDAIEAQESIYF